MFLTFTFRLSETNYLIKFLDSSKWPHIQEKFDQIWSSFFKHLRFIISFWKKLAVNFSHLTNQEPGRVVILSYRITQPDESFPKVVKSVGTHFYTEGGPPWEAQYRWRFFSKKNRRYEDRNNFFVQKWKMRVPRWNKIQRLFFSVLEEELFKL